MPFLGALLCFASCISTTIACGVGELQLSAASPPQSDYELVRVNPDGSAVLLHAGVEQQFAAPGLYPDARPKVLASSYALQTVTVRVGFSERSYGWVWWPW